MIPDETENTRAALIERLFVASIVCVCVCVCVCLCGHAAAWSFETGSVPLPGPESGCHLRPVLGAGVLGGLAAPLVPCHTPHAGWQCIVRHVDLIVSRLVSCIRRWSASMCSGASCLFPCQNAIRMADEGNHRHARVDRQSFSGGLCGIQKDALCGVWMYG